jgi:hypothetical protein
MNTMGIGDGNGQHSPVHPETMASETNAELGGTSEAGEVPDSCRAPLKLNATTDLLSSSFSESRKEKGEVALGAEDPKCNNTTPPEATMSEHSREKDAEPICSTVGVNAEGTTNTPIPTIAEKQLFSMEDRETEEVQISQFGGSDIDTNVLLMPVSEPESVSKSSSETGVLRDTGIAENSRTNVDTKTTSGYPLSSGPKSPQNRTRAEAVEKAGVSRLSPKLTGPWSHSKSNKTNNGSVAKEAIHSPPFSPKKFQNASLLALPIDSLHSIASFLTPLEWKSFGLCSKGTNKVSGEIFRRVRMHGFRCATEVVTAWQYGQHADAKELCALYVSAGVPIYPHSLGHSYHTLIWRLSIEAKNLQEKNEQPQQTDDRNDPLHTSTVLSVGNQSGDSTTESLPAVDPFYNERDNLRRREELITGSRRRGHSYLEEKALYNLNSKAPESGINRFRRMSWTRGPIDQVHRRGLNQFHGMNNPQRLPQAPLNPPPIPPIQDGHWNSLTGSDRQTSPHRRCIRSNSFSGKSHKLQNISLKIHRHLLDQHLLGRPGVNDADGSMVTPRVSLSADFFHPYFSFQSSKETNRHERNGDHNLRSNSRGGSTSLLPTFVDATFSDDSDSDSETNMNLPRANRVEPLRLNNADELAAAGAALQPPSMVPPVPPVIPLTATMFPERIISPRHSDDVASGILSNIDLDVYSASNGVLETHKESSSGRDMKHYLKTRFGSYHRCLERHILNNDNHGFEETIMDFWDEFLPQSAGIQYYDRHTAVPRISRLQDFLTKPCPKAIGIVQCEIERVNSGTKKKGVNVKGRLFPTYEYRLFIRHRPSDMANDFEDKNNDDRNRRRDTVLMMAKNKGRKHTESPVQAPKKGSNNFYMTLPQQDDLDLHYNAVNTMEDSQKPAPNGVVSQTDSLEGSDLLGRLQSNFVGTEFQIFTPRLGMINSKTSQLIKATQSVRSGSNSDEAQPSPSRRRSRFRRLSLKGRHQSDDHRIDLSAPFQTHSTPLTLRRSLSAESPAGRNRKVSAAESFESQQFEIEPKPFLFEQEDGAITYTANLLGSRPRIMDVCIPKVNPDGPGMEWKRYLESCKDYDPRSSTDRLLNHLKQLQQNGQMDEHGRLINPANNEPEVLGSDGQDYSPSGDFGLLALQNRPPWWNVELGSFVLNFGGRVSVASVKNFQLCDRNDQDYIMLQFGRIEGRHAFTMDFQYPLTAVQAFAIAISSLQSKIAFG